MAKLLSTLVPDLSSGDRMEPVSVNGVTDCPPMSQTRPELLARSKAFWNPAKTRDWIDMGVDLVIKKPPPVRVAGVCPALPPGGMFRAMDTICGM